MFHLVSLFSVFGRVSAEEAKFELVPQSDDGPGDVNHPTAGSGLQTPEPYRQVTHNNSKQIHVSQ